jgi:hypothetical protein
MRLIARRIALYVVTAIDHEPERPADRVHHQRHGLGVRRPAVAGGDAVHAGTGLHHLRHNRRIIIKLITRGTPACVHAADSPADRR